jgi:hypothetical protein
MNTWQQDYEQALGINARRDPSWSWEVVAPEPEEKPDDMHLTWAFPLIVIAGLSLWAGLGWLLGWLLRTLT